MIQELELLTESSTWKSRPVNYVAGTWRQIKARIPKFELSDFVEGDESAVNPYYRTVIRLPLTAMEHRIPIGIVSQSYTLAQHSEVAELCIDGLIKGGIESKELRCELGLSELCEWMNFRIYFPDKYNYKSDANDSLNLRLECFNSVEGNSRLIIVFGWLRFICSNGMIVGETIAEIRDIHNRHMELKKITELIKDGMSQIEKDKLIIAEWENHQLNTEALIIWINKVLAKKWGKLAACRAYHICLSGRDVEYKNPFEAALPTEKGVIELDRVPGSSNGAKNIYDVSQVLSWLATNRNNAEEKTDWQMQITDLLSELRSYR